jgi:N-acetylglucosamine-6-sulfatase
LGHEESTVATWLDDAGYNTVLIGKYLNDYNDEDVAHVPQGWDEWYARLKTAEYYNYNISENGELVSYGSSEQDYLTDVETEKATDFISRAADSSEPLFMYLSPNAPHSPQQNAPRHDELFSDAQVPRAPSFNEADVSDKPARTTKNLTSLDASQEAALDQTYRERLRSLQAVDDMVEGVVNELAATGRLENTYIFFTSDNGYLLGEHRIAEKKGAIYEESIRVPMAVRGPNIPAGSTMEQLALNTDLAPSFADLAGAKPPDFVDGRSLRTIFTSDPFYWRTAFLQEFFMGKKEHRAVRTADGEKYVEYPHSDEREFYDLTTDPYELENTYQSANAALLKSLRSRLSVLDNCAGKVCQVAEDGPMAQQVWQGLFGR